MKVELENVLPRDIEKRSFEIITEELGDTPLIPGTELIVKRCIHTSADFDYAKNLRFLRGRGGKSPERDQKRRLDRDRHPDGQGRH